MRYISSFLLMVSSVMAFTKSGTTYTTDGSRSDVAAAVADSTAGDTVGIPSGSFTWGTSGTPLSLNKAITLAGDGTSSTTITIATDAPTWGTGIINISAAAVVKDFAVVQSTAGNPTTAFTAGTVNGWRITNITHTSSSTAGYFLYASTYGLVDNCNITGGGGSDELILTRGPTDSWQTASSLGTSSAVYIENCTFAGSGYVSDFNSNSRAVVRFCTITGPIKIDAHGKASNSPARSARSTEVYNNTWTYSSGYWTAIELRGGTGVVFDNTAAANSGATWFGLVEYGCLTTSTNWGVYQTPADYPIDDQIGVGVDPKSGGSEPYYIWQNTLGGNDWAPIGGSPVPDGAVSLYRTQTGNPAATFTMLGDIIVADRDFFRQTVGATFDGTGGIGRGTAAQMAAITPIKTGVGFWVTDEGSWRDGYGGTSGRLYKWSGSAWVLHYTPYTFPHPLTGGGGGGGTSGLTVGTLSVGTLQLN